MIVTFYSYKGGVGRSQLCANVASYLCHRRGLKILLMDWDFEAPGLHYFFNKTSADVKAGGVIELLSTYANKMRKNGEITENDYPYFKPENIIPLISKDPESDGGQVDLIPAGNYNDSYVFNVNTFDWYEFYELLDGKTYIEALKKWLKSSDYDIIFVDSRTGINDYSGICNIQLPDANVVVMAANNQNIDGCKRIIDQVIHSEYTKQGFRKGVVLPVLSRINVNHPQFKHWADRFTDLFHTLIPGLDKQIDTHFSREVCCEFFLDKTLLPDDPQYSAGENLLFPRSGQFFIPRNSFTAKFANLGEYILKISQGSDIGLFEQIDTETWLQWGEIAVADEENLKAAIAFEKAGDIKRSIELGGTDISFFLEGNNHYTKGNKHKAIEYYQKAIELNSDFVDPLNNIGAAYTDLGDKQKAIEFYQKAIDLDPNFVDALNNLGNTYADIGQKHKAIEYFQKAIAVNPNDYEVISNLGLTYADLGDKQKAIEFYQKAVKLNPDFIDALNNMGLAYADLGQGRKAIDCFQKAVAVNPNDYEVFNNLGLTYSELGDKQKAIVCFQKSIKINPEYSYAFVSMGATYAELGEKQKAIECYQEAIDIKQDFALAIYNMGLIYSDIGEEQKAIVCYQRAIEVDPHYADAYVNLGFALIEAGNIRDAEFMLSKAIEFGRIDKGYMNLGHVFLAKNQPEEALSLYKKSVEAHDDKQDFWKGMEDDFKHLQQYGITSEQYNAILKQIRDCFLNCVMPEDE